MTAPASLVDGGATGCTGAWVAAKVGDSDGGGRWDETDFGDRVKQLALTIGHPWRAGRRGGSDDSGRRPAQGLALLLPEPGAGGATPRFVPTSLLHS